MKKLFDFRCQDCNRLFEDWSKGKYDVPLCPNCNSTSITRLLCTPHVADDCSPHNYLEGSKARWDPPIKVYGSGIPQGGNKRKK